jgi:serine/threonine-protein kinase RsbW
LSDNLKQLTLKVASRLEVTDSVEEYFRLFVRNSPVSQDRVDWIALSIREAINNAILYGNKKDPAKHVEIVFEYPENNDSLSIKIWDQGKGFDVHSLLDPTKEENLLRPHGRGIFLIRQFVDHVQFLSREPKGFGIELVVNFENHGK